jgi:hypothetical protein
MNKCDAEIYLKNFKRIFDVTTKNIYFHIDNYGDSSCYFWEYNKSIYGYFTINKKYAIGAFKSELEVILLKIINDLTNKHIKAHIISFTKIDTYKDNIMITMTVATKSLI